MERVHSRGEKKNTVIGIRADGNETIGMGHLMRCLSVALALRQSGVPVVFLTAEESAGEWLLQKGFENVVLHSDYTRMEEETESLKKVIRERNISLLLIDSYQVTKHYLATVRECVKTVCMEEEIKEVYPVDGVINYNVYAPFLDYKEKYPEGTCLYLGSSYAPLRPEFGAGDYAVRDRVKSLLLTMGGSDGYNICGQLLKAFLQSKEPFFQSLEYEVVCGAFNPHRQQLLDMAKQYKNVHIRVQVEDMAGLMRQSDIAVTAAGSTIYELAAVGVPSVCCYYVDNQKRIAEGFAQMAGIVNAGDYSREPEAVTVRILQRIKEMGMDVKLRRTTAEAMRNISDGRGAKRLAEALKEQLGKE